MAPAHPLSWDEEGRPRSDIYDEAFFAGGRAEVEHVYLGGNSLPARWHGWTGPFHLAELGFGTGLNFAVALAAWREAGAAGPLHFTSIEHAPLPQADQRRAIAPWPDLWALAEPFLAALTAAPGWQEVGHGEVTLTLGIGEAEALIGDVAPADAWFLDGFSPARNPAMWTPTLLGAVACATQPGGTAATFTAAGQVRRTLAEAGFTVERRPGFARKRHMTAAVLDRS
ncbi:MAG: tRNA (5-methylaminomethyl-2-thiouridine)(34)-methyltransferase MnmD [Pseudomonadota bacterium]